MRRLTLKCTFLEIRSIKMRRFRRLNYVSKILYSPELRVQNTITQQARCEKVHVEGHDFKIKTWENFFSSYFTSNITKASRHFSFWNIGRSPGKGLETSDFQYLHRHVIKGVARVTREH